MNIDYRDYIEIVPGKRGGKPCVKGTRITVYDVLGWLGGGRSVADILYDFPHLTETQIRACLMWAAHREQNHMAILAA